MGDETPLDFVTTEELIAELRKRADHMLVVVCSDTKTGDGQGACVYYGGGWIGALGLAEFGRNELLNKVNGPDSDDDDDEF